MASEKSEKTLIAAEEQQEDVEPQPNPKKGNGYIVVEKKLNVKTVGENHKSMHIHIQHFSARDLLDVKEMIVNNKNLRTLSIHGSMLHNAQNVGEGYDLDNLIQWLNEEGCTVKTLAVHDVRNIQFASPHLKEFCSKLTGVTFIRCSAEIKSLPVFLDGLDNMKFFQFEYISCFSDTKSIVTNGIHHFNYFAELNFDSFLQRNASTLKRIFLHGKSFTANPQLIFGLPHLEKALCMINEYDINVCLTDPKNPFAQAACYQESPLDAQLSDLVAKTMNMVLVPPIHH